MKVTVETRAFIAQNARAIIRNRLKSKLEVVLGELMKWIIPFVRPDGPTYFSAQALLALAVVNFRGTNRFEQLVEDMDVPVFVDNATCSLVKLIQSMLPEPEILAVDSLGEGELNSVLAGVIGQEGYVSEPLDLSIFYRQH
jgi:hypothetical protein